MVMGARGADDADTKSCLDILLTGCSYSCNQPKRLARDRNHCATSCGLQRRAFSTLKIRNAALLNDRHVAGLRKSQAGALLMPCVAGCK
jgi:hypothetical protein